MTAETSSRLLAGLPPELGTRVSAEDAGAYAVQGMVPDLTAKPASVEEVSALLAAAYESSSAVVPWGSGSHMGIGNRPRAYDLALDLRGLDQVIEYEPADMTVTVQAGMPLSTLQQRLEEHHQRLNLDPPAGETATIGGLLAVNASGPSRMAFGTARDLLIGIQVVTPTGILVKAGGRVVKNVAGYDMGKLHIGALGTLGVIVQATFRLHPLPRHQLILRTAGSLPAMLEASSQLAAAGLSIAALMLSRIAEAPDWQLLLKIEGGDAAAERSERDSRAVLQRLSLPALDAGQPEWAAALTIATPSSDALEIIAKGVVDQKALPDLLDAAERDGAAVCCYPASGLAYLQWPAAEIAAPTLQGLRRQCEASPFGVLVIEAAPPGFQLDAWGRTREDFALMQRLKQEIDPKGILSPGRFLGGL